MPSLLLNSLLFFLRFFDNSSFQHEEEIYQKIKPTFETVKYKASIDVVGKHLSGILIFKTQEDSSIRSVFVNEMGITFFDITFSKDNYVFHSIMESMDKKAVKITLAKDLGMILMIGIFIKNPIEQIPNIHILQLKLKRKGIVQYDFEDSTNHINTIQNFGKRKKVVEINQYYSTKNTMPDSIFVHHQTVNFTISLKQLYATE